jgi:hypothetical protein
MYGELTIYTGLSFFPFFFFGLLCWVGVHSDIYKTSYNVSNISYLNSPSSALFHYNTFSRCHFCVYIHVFLLAWGKDSYAERFLELLPCTCVLQPTLVHHYQTFSLLPSPLPIVASASLRLLYSLLNGEHINHTQVLGFLPCGLA